LWNPLLFSQAVPLPGDSFPGRHTSLHASFSTAVNAIPFLLLPLIQVLLLPVLFFNFLAPPLIDELETGVFYTPAVFITTSLSLWGDGAFPLISEAPPGPLRAAYPQLVLNSLPWLVDPLNFFFRAFGEFNLI